MRRRLGQDCVSVEPPRPPNLVEADLGVAPFDLDLPGGLMEGLRGDAVQLVRSRQPCSDGWKSAELRSNLIQSTVAVHIEIIICEIPNVKSF